MIIDDFLMAKLEKYLLGEMNLQERKIFDIEITNSDELQEFIEIYEQIESYENKEGWNVFLGDKEKLKKTLALFQDKDTLAFSQKLKTFQQQQTSKTSKKNQWKKIIAYSTVAASLLFLLYSVFLQPTNLNAIYKQHNSWNEIPSLSVKGGESLTKKKEKLEQLFIYKQYEDVIKLGKSISNSANNIDPNILLYVGVSQIEINKYDDAIHTFNTLIESNTIDNHKGYWYKALVYLKRQDKSLAKKQLQKIVDKQYFNSNKAAIILKKLN